MWSDQLATCIYTIPKQTVSLHKERLYETAYALFLEECYNCEVYFTI